jgi:hypothetical protein
VSAVPTNDRRRQARATVAVAGVPLEIGWLVRWLPAVALTLLDAALTYTWLELGVAAEGNPWLAGVVETSGPAAAMALRAGIGLVLVGFLAVLARRHESARRGLLFVTAALGLVCSWHVVGSLLTVA